MHLEYPIEQIHNNLALTKNHEVVAFYTIPHFSNSVIDGGGREQLKGAIEQSVRKLSSYMDFELALVPRDYLLHEKMNELKRTLYPNFQKVGSQELDLVTHRLTQEMELPYQYEWVLAVFLPSTPTHLRSMKQLFKEKLERQIDQTMGWFGRQVRVSETWWKNYEAQEWACLQGLQALKPTRLNEAQLYYHQRLQFLPYIPHQYESVMAGRSMTSDLRTGAIVCWRTGPLSNSVYGHTGVISRVNGNSFTTYEQNINGNQTVQRYKRVWDASMTFVIILPK